RRRRRRSTTVRSREARTRRSAKRRWLPSGRIEATAPAVEFAAMPIDYLKKILTAKVYDVAEESPLELADILSDRLSNRVLLKREDMQPVFSFKLRGAYNRMARLPAQTLARGVIAASAGNH